jgi:hypothetical protein
MRLVIPAVLFASFMLVGWTAQQASASVVSPSLGDAVPGPSSSEAPIDLPGLIVPAADLGPHWVPAQGTGIGSTDLLRVYVASYSNELDYLAPRIVTFNLLTTELVPAEVILQGLGTASTGSGSDFQPFPGLGDGAAYRSATSTDAGPTIAYLFRVRNVVAVVAVGSLEATGPKFPPPMMMSQIDDDLDQQTLEYARLQEAHLRAEPATSGPIAYVAED